MNEEIMRKVEAAHLKEVPEFFVGDTVEVGIRVQEGDRVRVQPFVGVVTRKRAGGINANFTVRRIVQGEGVERTFVTQSPTLDHIEVTRSGKVRQARLYYLRDLRGKAARIKAKSLPGQTHKK